MAHRPPSSTGFNRSPSLQHGNSLVGQLQRPIKPTVAAADLYNLPSPLPLQSPPPAYDLSARSTHESIHNFRGNQPTPPKRDATGSTSQVQQDDSSRYINAGPGRAPRGPGRPKLPPRSTSEFIPYSAYYYLIHTSNHCVDQPTHVNQSERVSNQINQVPDSAPNSPRGTLKRKVNKLRKPRPVPSHLAHQSKVNQAYQHSDNPVCTPIGQPLKNASRVNSQKVKKGIFKRLENINIGVSASSSKSTAASSILPERQTSRQFRDEKRMALVNAEDPVPPSLEIPSHLNICLHCKFCPSNHNQFNINLSLKPHSNLYSFSLL